MAPPRGNYSGLTNIQDPAVAQVCKQLMDQLNLLKGQAKDVPLMEKGVDANGQRVRGVATPTDPDDAVPLSYIEDNLSPEKIRAMLQLGGAAPLSVVNLPGVEAALANDYGTHAERLLIPANSVVDGYTFYETDRAALYQAQLVGGEPAWVLVMCRPLRTADALPTDLGNNDAGFTWFDQVLGITFRWSGGSWNYYLGSYVAAYSAMPSAALADRGFFFIASDLGEHVWRKGSSAFELVEGMGGPHYCIWADRPTLTAEDAGFYMVVTDRGDHWYRWSGSAWVLRVGLGGPMRGTLSPNQKPAGMGANDAGFLFYSTDFDRVYRFTGAGWQDAPG